jgi:hypothetical protein
MPRKVLTSVAPEPREDGGIQIEVTLPVRQNRRKADNRERPDQVSNPGSHPRIPRITRLMALAIKFQDMVDRREIHDYADLARLGYVTRARVTQIMNLLHLAPDIQEDIMFLEGYQHRSSVTERDLRSLARTVNWEEQRRRFRRDHPTNKSTTMNETARFSRSSQSGSAHLC